MPENLHWDTIEGAIDASEAFVRLRSADRAPDGADDRFGVDAGGVQ